jgi:hypothetical protein
LRRRHGFGEVCFGGHDGTSCGRWKRGTKMDATAMERKEQVGGDGRGKLCLCFLVWGHFLR